MARRDGALRVTERRIRTQGGRMPLMNLVRSRLGRALAVSRMHRLAVRNRSVVVAFHRVTDALPEDGLTRSSRAFEQFCRFFRDNFDVVPLGDVIGRLRRGVSVGGTLAITFDDGYLDNFEVAAPILDKLGLPATFFVATGWIGSRVVPWWDVQLPAPAAWMSWDNVQMLSRSGFDIGGHTRNHVDLGKVDGDEAQEEITGCRNDLLERLGKEARHFGYPYGGRENLLESNRRRIAEAGFGCCVSCHGGTIKDGADPFRLSRVPISMWYKTPEQFCFEVAVRSA
jgi:peptidoglycan/xylan/chitin deacetylase (PgdA/CDA1 family)